MPPGVVAKVGDIWEEAYRCCDWKDLVIARKGRNGERRTALLEGGV